MANKRVIDLAELSQTVQEGQYIIVDSAGGTGKMNLKQIVDDNAIDPDGVYPDLIAGDLATDKHQTDTTPYLFRPSASVGNRAYETIVGASVGANQLVQSGATSVTVQSGHKYYAKIDGTESIGASTGSAITINDSAKDMVTDLTAELGTSIADYIYFLESATAGSGIAKLREWGFCTGYVPYNAGSIESVEVTEKKVVGFNQWNEEWEVGGYNSSTGEAVALTDRIRGKNYIPVIPSATYYFAIPSSTSGNVFFYDANKAFLSSRFLYAGTFSVPSNAYYLHIAMQPTYGTTYNNDICINLSSDRNGEYEPYKSASYPLGTDTLRGIFKLDNGKLYADGDVKTSDGTITRKYGVVTLDGTETWEARSGKQNEFYVRGATPDAFVLDSSTQLTVNEIATSCGYRAMTWEDYNTNSTDRVISFYYGQPWLIVRDSSFSTADALKTYLASHPMTVVYLKAIPTTEQSTSFTSPQVCYPDGTEEYVTENNVPVGHGTDYPYSIKALAEELIDIPDVPSATGTYVLKATRSASGITYAWVTG